MATCYRRLTALDGAQHINAYLRAFTTLYGPYEAFLRGGEVYEADYYNRKASLIRLNEGILNGEAKILSISQRVMHVRIGYIERIEFRYVTTKILTPVNTPNVFNLPELFIISKD